MPAESAGKDAEQRMEFIEDKEAERGNLTPALAKLLLALANSEQEEKGVTTHAA